MDGHDYFLAIAETGNISRAAEKLYISQPSLSKYLRRLENELGVELFNRASYPLRLTEAGELYLSYVKEEAIRAKNLRRSFANLRSPERGEVRVGLTPWRSASLLPEILEVFWREHPFIRVCFEEGPHQHLASLLEHDRVDFALTHLPSKYQGFSCTNELLMTDEAVFVVNRDNPLLSDLPECELDEGGIGSLSEEQFALFQNEPFVMFRENQNIYETLHPLLERSGALLNVKLVTPNIHTAMNFVHLGLGVGFTTTSYAKISNDDSLRYFIVGGESMRWDIAVTYKKSRPLSSQASLLVDCLHRYCLERFGSRERP